MDDDFFDLGGHSLSAMRLQAALKALKPKVEITLTDVLRARTPKRVAQLLETMKDKTMPAPVPCQALFVVVYDASYK